jgi:hypothetical protein
MPSAHRFGDDDTADEPGTTQHQHPHPAILWPIEGRPAAPSCRFTEFTPRSAAFPLFTALPRSPALPPMVDW